MVGTTRSRVNFFMNKFRKLGFIEYNGVLKVHHALLSVVLPRRRRFRSLKAARGDETSCGSTNPRVPDSTDVARQACDD